MGVDVGEPRVDLGDAVRVGGVLGLVQQRGALGVGRQHGVEQALRPVRRLLRHHAEAGIARQVDAAGFAVQLAGDDLQQGRLAGAVAPDQPGMMPGRQRQRGCVEEDAPGDPVGEVGDGQHGGAGDSTRAGRGKAGDARRAGACRRRDRAWLTMSYFGG